MPFPSSSNLTSSRFGKILTRRLPGFDGLTDKQVSDALDVFKEAYPKTSSGAEALEMRSLLDALTAGDERAVKILTGRGGWEWHAACDHCPEGWSNNPAKRRETLLALRALYLKETGQ